MNSTPPSARSIDGLVPAAPSGRRSRRRGRRGRPRRGGPSPSTPRRAGRSGANSRATVVLPVPGGAGEHHVVRERRVRHVALGPAAPDDQEVRQRPHVRLRRLQADQRVERGQDLGDRAEGDGRRRTRPCRRGRRHRDAARHGRRRRGRLADLVAQRTEVDELGDDRLAQRRHARIGAREVARLQVLVAAVDPLQHREVLGRLPGRVARDLDVERIAQTGRDGGRRGVARAAAQPPGQLVKVDHDRGARRQGVAQRRGPVGGRRGGDLGEPVGAAVDLLGPAARLLVAGPAHDADGFAGGPPDLVRDALADQRDRERLGVLVGVEPVHLRR